MFFLVAFRLVAGECLGEGRRSEVDNREEKAGMPSSQNPSGQKAGNQIWWIFPKVHTNSFCPVSALYVIEFSRM